MHVKRRNENRYKPGTASSSSLSVRVAIASHQRFVGFDRRRVGAIHLPNNHGCQRSMVARKILISSGRKSTKGGRTGPPARPIMSIIAFIAETS